MQSLELGVETGIQLLLPFCGSFITEEDTTSKRSNGMHTAEIALLEGTGVPVPMDRALGWVLSQIMHERRHLHRRDK